jgi:hypothetical protein
MQNHLNIALPLCKPPFFHLDYVIYWRILLLMGNFGPISSRESKTTKKNTSRSTVLFYFINPDGLFFNSDAIFLEIVTNRRFISERLMKLLVGQLNTVFRRTCRCNCLCQAYCRLLISL